MTPKPPEDDEDALGGYASPPCYMHEVDPLYFGLDAGLDAQQHQDVTRWRKAERERLIAARLGLCAENRQAADLLQQAGHPLDDRVDHVPLPGGRLPRNRARSAR